MGYSCEHLEVSPTAAAAAAKSLQSCPTLCDPRRGDRAKSQGFLREQHGWGRHAVQVFIRVAGGV